MNCNWTLKISDEQSVEFDNLEDLDKYIKNNMPEYLTLGGVKYNFDDVVNKISLDSKLSKTNNVSGVLDYIDKIGLVQGFNSEEFEKMFKENLTKTLSENKNSSSDMIKLEVEKAWENKIEEIKKSRELGKGVHLLIETLLSSIKNSPRLTDGMLNNIFNSVISKTNTKINEYNTKIANKELNPPIDGIVPSLEGFNETNLKDVLNQFINTIYNPLINNSNKVWIRTEQNLQEKLGEDFANNPEVSVSINSIKGKLDILFIYEDKDTKKVKADIIDIKTSGKFADNWDIDRLSTVDAQLAIYKRLLARKGIYENDITTKSLVIKLNTSDLNNITIEGQLDAKVTSISPEKSKVIEKLLPLEEKISPEDTDFANKVEDDLNKFWDIDPETKELTSSLQDRIKSRIRKEPVGSEVQYRAIYWKEDGSTDSEVFKTLEAAEDFVKNDIAKNVDKSKWVSRITNIIENGLKEGKVTGLFVKSSDESNSFWERNLTKYINVKGWRIENNSIYNRLNVLVFVNSITKEVDIIKLAKNIDRKVKISNNSNILGKFISDDVAYKNREDFMPSTIANIELIKALAIVNRLNLPNYTIGELKVLDSANNRGTCSIVDKDLLTNFKTLCKKTDTPYNDLQFKDKYLQALDLIIYATNNIGNPSTINILTEKANAFYTEQNTARQLDTLSEIADILGKEHDDYRKDVQNASYNTFSGFVYLEIMNRIAALSKRRLDLNTNEETTNYGMTKGRGMGNGLKINSLDSIRILDPISRLKTSTDTNIRIQYTNYKSQDNKVTQPYINYASSQSVGNRILANPLVNVETVIYSKFYDKNETGDLVLIDPNDNSKNSELTERDKQYLRGWLEELNSYRVKESGGSLTIDKLKASGMYWRVPLMKSGTSSRLIHNQIKDLPKGAALDYNLQLQDYNNETNIILDKYDSSKIKAFKMSNSIALSDSEVQRSRLLDGVNPYLNYETNLEAVKDMYVQSYIIEKEWNKQMVILNAVMVNLKLSNYLYGESTDNLIEFLNDFITSSIQGKSILHDEFKGPAKVYGFAKKCTTMAVLGLNWKSGFKEFVMSNYTLYKNAVVNSRLDKDRLSISDVNFATKFIWGDLFQQADANKITMAQGLNFIYGMVNNTIYESAENQNFNVTKAFKWSNRMMWPNKFPDFTGRMTLLVGYLHKVGALDAHSIENDYDVVYDWTKDERFKLFAKDKTGKTISDSEKEEWSKQKGNYVSRILQLRNEGFEIQDKETGEFRQIELTDDLPIAFTTEEIKGIKQESNTMFGYMDPDEKSIIFKMAQGLLFGHFSTFLTAKKNQLFLRTAKNGQGKWVQVKDYDTGLPMYQKEILDKEGNVIDYEPTTEVTDTPLYGWNGTITEGMVWTLIDLFNVTKMDNLKAAWQDPYKRKNALIALEDLFAFLLLVITGNMLFGDRKNAKGAEKIAANMMFNSAQDINGFQALAGIAQFQVPTIDFITNIGVDVKKLLLGDIDFNYFVGNRFSVSRDFISK